MGAPKATLVVDGVRLVDRAVALLREAGCERILAVVRPGVDVVGAELVVNHDPDRGMRSSLALAVDAAGPDGPLVVVLVDMPGVDAAGVRAVLAAWQPGRVAAARYHERVGHPVAMAPQLWRAAIALAGPDEGARTFITAHPELVDEVAVSGDPADLDTRDDLRR